MIRPALVGFLVSLTLQGAPAIQTFTLPNGLRVHLLEDHATQLVRASLRVAWKASEEPSGKEGLGVFLASLLEHTASGAPFPAAFSGRVAGSAIKFQFRPATGRMEWSAAARSADQEAALQAIAYAVMRPSLEGPMVEAQRLNAGRGLEATPPSESIRNRFLASLQGVHLGDEATLKHLGLPDLDAFHHRIVRPERAVLGLTGDLTLAQARSLTLLHLGAWGPATAPGTAAGGEAPRLLHHAEGAPEAWLGVPLSGRTPGSLAAAELLALMLEFLPDTPFRRSPEGKPFLLFRNTAPASGDLPAAIAFLRQRLQGVADLLTPAAFDQARDRWRREEAVLRLNPGRWMDRTLDRSLERAARPEDVQGATLTSVRAFYEQQAAAPRLLLLGTPKRTVAEWLQESSALAPWGQSETATPNREARSR